MLWILLARCLVVFIEKVLWHEKFGSDCLDLKLSQLSHLPVISVGLGGNWAVVEEGSWVQSVVEVAPGGWHTGTAWPEDVPTIFSQVLQSTEGLDTVHCTNVPAYCAKKLVAATNWKLH